ncbi:MAG TPA: hypothetical protein VJL90_15260 [Pseudorhodoplanes sp.]|nr:hypothetical protein [Pseudorhodoplanes sp.]
MTDFIEDAKVWATMPIPGADASGEQRKIYDAMSIDQLAEIWQALQHVGLRDQTEGTWDTTLYFDALPHNEPERALDLVLAVLRTEQDRLVLLQLGDKFTTSLIHAHAGTLIDRLEREVRGNPKLRWLLGGAYWWAPSEPLKARLERIADIESWRADRDASRAPPESIDFASLSPAALARVWIEQSGKPQKDQNDLWSELRDYEREISNNDPDRMLDMILEVLKIETNERMLGYLAAGPLEDAIGMNTIDRVEREAAANKRFRWLLGGVWYYSAPDELKARLDAIIKEHW